MITNIINNKSVWKLLALISYSPGAGYTRKEIIKLLNWNNLTLDRTLEKVNFYNIIIKNKRVIKLNFENPDTSKLLDIMEYEKKKMNFPSFELFILLKDFLRLIESKNIKNIYLFGSHAKKIASVNSDIDIAIFSNEKINLIEAKQTISDHYEKEIQLHYFKSNEKNIIIEEVIKHGVKLI
jgi:predicted nucleotidyltransferase